MSALQKSFVRGPVLTSFVEIEETEVTHIEYSRTKIEVTETTEASVKGDRKTSKKRGGGDGKQFKSKNKTGKKGKYGTKGNGSHSEATRQWCNAVHKRLKHFLTSDDGHYVEFELLGPLTNPNQKRFAVSLCKDIYLIPCKLVVLGKDHFLSISYPVDHKIPRGEELLGLDKTERAVRQLIESLQKGASVSPQQSGSVVVKPAAKGEIVAEGEDPLWEREKDNVGLSLLQKMGWEVGMGLGKQEQGEIEPVAAVTKPNRLGVGIEATSTTPSSATSSVSKTVETTSKKSSRRQKRNKQRDRDEKING